MWSDWGGLTGPALVLEDTLGAFNRAKQPLIRCRRLHDQHRLPIDRQHRRPAAALEPLPSTPEQLGQLIKTETVKWAKVIKDSGAKLD